jgi:mRNA-degrading endonuclease RelE of RelBE toxin-antitoxin system
MIVIKFHEWLKIQPDFREIVYELCDDEFKKIRRVTKEEAIELIEEYHLHKVHQNRYGSIWR